MLRARLEYEKHLSNLLLSHQDGIQCVKSLLHAQDPAVFVAKIRDIYKGLPAESDLPTNRIGEGVGELDGYLRSLDISCNPGLRRVPVKRLCDIKTLEFLGCEGCPYLYGVPPEVAKLGGTRAMQYLKDITETGTPNTELQIIVIGNGEAGKSSLISCVVNEVDDKAAEIKEDDRTVGIDITEWKPKKESLTCRFLDLAGQQVYACTNQFFLVPRALYVIAWRVLNPAAAGEHVNGEIKTRELENMILSWMEALQVRVPGASIIMVATHIDQAAQEEVARQCGLVEKIVRRKLAQIQLEAATASVAALEVFENGKSVRVQCLDGTGVKDLRDALIKKAVNLPWYAEPIPRSYQELRRKIDHLRNNGEKQVWLSWDDYRRHAESSGIKTASALVIATSFLSEMGVIKYFGDLDDSATPKDTNNLLHTTVFVCTAWIIDGLKGLIRHDRDTLIEYLQKHTDISADKQRRLQQHVNRLATYGICHSSIIPFLWPDGGDQDASRYWRYLQQHQVEGELRLWPGLTSSPPNAFAKNIHDYDRVIALLSGCDFLYKKVVQRYVVEPVDSTNREEAEYVAPVLLVQDAKMDARSYSATDCPIKHEYSITGGAPGFFDRLLVRIQRSYSHVECSKTAGVFYHRALKAQMFLVDGTKAQGKKDTGIVGASSSNRPVSVRRSAPGASRLKSHKNFARDGTVQGAASAAVSKLCVLTSTRAQQVHIMKELKDLGCFFPGMTIGPYPNEAMMKADRDAARKEPVHIRIVALSKEVALAVEKEMMERDRQNNGQRSNDAMQLRIKAGGVFGGSSEESMEEYPEEYMDFTSRIVVICMENLGYEKWDPHRLTELRHELDQYENTFLCKGQFVDSSKLRGMYEQCIPSKSNGRNLDQETAKGSCQHSRPQDAKAQNPCEQCNDAEGFRLAEKEGRCDDARVKLAESIRLRDKSMDTEFPQTEWSASHRQFIEGLRDAANQQQRMIGQELNPNASAKRVLKLVMSLLIQLSQAEKRCRECHEEEIRLLSGLIPSSKSNMCSPNPSGGQEAVKDAVEKRVYFQKKYALMWARLEVLQFRLHASIHMPALEREKDKVFAKRCGITDMRRAHDAQKGRRQTAEMAEQSEDNLTSKLKAMREIDKKAAEINELLETELKWMVYTEEFMYHVRKQVKVIPLIMPGYFADVEKQRGKVDFSSWWPTRMAAMESHALFTRLDNESASQNSQNYNLLMEDINKCLDGWRGKPPPADVFHPPDHIPCYLCIESREKNPHEFSRVSVEAQLKEWQALYLKNNSDKGNLSSGIHQIASADSFRTRAFLDSTSEQKCILRCEQNAEHRLDAVELLSSASIFEAVPCPMCISSHDLPPHTFDRKVCMQWFTAGNMTKGGSVTCPKCDAQGRPCRMKIIDLIQPQVFFSYQWGRDRSTQNYVVPLRERIEFDTELLVWLDIGGGMGVGDNHIAAMYEGIRNATVVVIFLSDAYVNSPNCQREFLHAVRNCKYIVPVLVPPETRDDSDGDKGSFSDPSSDKYVPNSGWTGSYNAQKPCTATENKKWFEHVWNVMKQTSGSVQNDPDPPHQIIDWAFLGRFEPIDMRDAETAFVEGSPQEQTLSKRIMSRFHRGNDIDHATRKKYDTWKQNAGKMQVLLKGFRTDDIASLTKDSVQDMFNRIDTDGSGTINADEMKAYFNELGAELDDATVAALLDEADSNHSRDIDLDEFHGVLRELVVAKQRSVNQR